MSEPETPEEALAAALPDWMVEHPIGETEDELRASIAGNILAALRDSGWDLGVRMMCESEVDWSDDAHPHPPTVSAECHFCAGDVRMVAKMVANPPETPPATHD